MPVPTDSIDALPYSGDANDFSGGYALGDTVVTSTSGPSVARNTSCPTKWRRMPTILFNGSVTCIGSRTIGTRH